MTIISQCSDRSAEVFLIHKDCKVPDMSDIIKKYINYLKKNSNLISIKYEDSIIDKYTDLDKKDFKIFDKDTDNLSRREDYFFDMFPEDDSSDDVVEWLNKNQRDEDFISRAPTLCLMAVLVSTNKKMTLSKLSKLSLNSLVTAFESAYKEENVLIFSDDDHKKQVLRRNDDRVNKFDKFFQRKNIVDFYSEFLPYIKDVNFKKAIYSTYFPSFLKPSI